MRKLLKIGGIMLLVLVILLLPLFGIYASTAASVPGEKIYPLKQQSEQIIDHLSRVNPTVYAYFSLLKSKRRYQEVISLSDRNQDISEANRKFLGQIKQTIFDIQSVPSEGTKLTYIAQYQSFLSNAKEALAYKTTGLEETLGIEPEIKTFTIDQFGAEGGKLIAKPKVIEQKAINQKNPVPESLILQNIEQLKESQIVISGLIP